MEQSSSWELERKLCRGRGKQRGEERRKRGIVFCSLDVDARLVRSFHPLAVHSNTLQGQKRKGEKKKRNFYVSARCLPRFMIADSVTDEISMPMEARPIFHIEISLSLPTVGRVTYFPVLTSKWTSSIYHIYNEPSNQCRETICLKTVPRSFRTAFVILIWLRSPLYGIANFSPWDVSLCFVFRHIRHDIIFIEKAFGNFGQ